MDLYDELCSSGHPSSLKLTLYVFCTSCLRDRTSIYLMMKSTFNIVRCQDTCEPICLKLGIVLSTTTFKSFVEV